MMLQSWCKWNCTRLSHAYNTLVIWCIFASSWFRCVFFLSFFSSFTSMSVHFVCISKNDKFCCCCSSVILWRFVGYSMYRFRYREISFRKNIGNILFPVSETVSVLEIERLNRTNRKNEWIENVEKSIQRATELCWSCVFTYIQSHTHTQTHINDIHFDTQNTYPFVHKQAARYFSSCNKAFTHHGSFIFHFEVFLSPIHPLPFLSLSLSHSFILFCMVHLPTLHNQYIRNANAFICVSVSSQFRIDSRLVLMYRKLLVCVYPRFRSADIYILS